MPGADTPDVDAAVIDCEAAAVGASGSYIATISNSVNPKESPITTSSLDKKPITSAPSSGLDYQHCNPHAFANWRKSRVTTAATAAADP